MCSSDLSPARAGRTCHAAAAAGVIPLRPLLVMLPAFPFGDTARLQLRPLVAHEARALLAIVAGSRDELGRFMSWPRDMIGIDQARQFVRIGREAWLQARTARLGVFDRASGELLGSVELDAIDLRRSQAELGYWIRSDRTRRGYAAEAAWAALRYAFETLQIHKVRADVAVGNQASGRPRPRSRIARPTLSLRCPPRRTSR